MLRPHEDQFLAQVEGHLAGLPFDRRQALVATVRQHLVDRPPTKTATELQRQLGTPGEYARSLLDGNDAAEDGVPIHAIAASAAPATLPKPSKVTPARVVTAVVIGILVVVVATVGFTIVRRKTAQARIEASGWRVAYVGTDSRAGITTSQAGTTDQDTIDYRPDGSATLEVELNGDPHLAVTDVDMGSGASPGSMAHLVRVQVSPGPDQGGWMPLTSALLGEGGRWVRLTFHFSNCQTFASSAGTWVAWDAFNVTYRAHGRTRRLERPLPSVFAVRIPTGVTCPAA